MKVGIQLPEVERDVGWTELRDMAITAERIGLDSIWTGDHLLYRDDSRPPRAGRGRSSPASPRSPSVELGPLVAATSSQPRDAREEGGDGRRDQRRGA